MQFSIYYLYKFLIINQGSFALYLSWAPSLGFSVSAFIFDRAAAASSSAHDTDEDSLRKTSGSAKALPSEVDNFPIPVL